MEINGMVYVKYDEVKERLEELEEELKNANESITWWTNRFNAVERNNKIYKERIDKAIKYIKEYNYYEWNINRNEEGKLNAIPIKTNLVNCECLLKILKGEDKE